MAKVEFAVPLIWYSNPSTGENEPRVRRKEGEEEEEEEEVNSIALLSGRLW
jgi:hypothetical protein